MTSTSCNNNLIDPKDISVVVQGAVDVVLTPKCLKSIRKFLPGAEIILSTWEGSNTEGLDYDKLVLNKDPGYYICDEDFNIKNNVNRQIVSTKNGLKTASRKYAFKTRTDIAITSTNFLTYWNKFTKRSSECKVLNERVLINNLYCANPVKTKLLFHISDWVFFGLKEDVLRIWDIPEMSLADATYFKNHARYMREDPLPNCIFRWIPEQYIWSKFLCKSGRQFVFNHFADFNKSNLKETELSFANNVVIIDYESFGISFIKYYP